MNKSFKDIKSLVEDGETTILSMENCKVVSVKNKSFHDFKVFLNGCKVSSISKAYGHIIGCGNMENNNYKCIDDKKGRQDIGRVDMSFNEESRTYYLTFYFGTTNGHCVSGCNFTSSFKIILCEDKHHFYIDERSGISQNQHYEYNLKKVA